MKKWILLFFTALSVGASQAQTTEGAAKTELTKEEKAKARAEKEKEEEAVFVAAGLTPDEISKAKAIINASQKQGKEVSKSSLTDEEKKTRKKELGEARRKQLIELLGEQKYKAWQQEKKKHADKGE